MSTLVFDHVQHTLHTIIKWFIPHKNSIYGIIIGLSFSKMILQKILIWSIAIFPALMWLGIYYYADKKPEKVRLIKITFITGILAIIPLLIIKKFIPTSNGIVYLIFIGAILEEIFKLIPTTYIMDRYKSAHDEVTDGIIYAVSLALGYAMIENIYILREFLFLNSYTNQLLAGILYRSVSTTLAHSVFSGIFGYYYMRAFLNLRRQKIQGLIYTIKDEVRCITSITENEVHDFIRNIKNKALSCLYKDFKKDTSKLRLFGFGMIIAISMHIIYNLTMYYMLFGKVLTPITIPLIFVGFWYLVRKERMITNLL